MGFGRQVEAIPGLRSLALNGACWRSRPSRENRTCPPAPASLFSPVSSSYYGGKWFFRSKPVCSARKSLSSNPINPDSQTAARNAALRNRRIPFQSLAWTRRIAGRKRKRTKLADRQCEICSIARTASQGFLIVGSGSAAHREKFVLTNPLEYGTLAQPGNLPQLNF